MDKPTKAKPSFYAHCYFNLKEIAKELGYNLLLHGSVDRDLDIVAVPWVDEPESHLQLLQAFNKYLNGIECQNVSGRDEDIINASYLPSILPGGRSSYIINLNRGGKFNGYIDEQYYLDISITPLVQLLP